MLFTGSGVAIITPFDKNNKINYKKFNELLNFHIANNTDAIIVCGTTGESATLDTNEKKELIKFTVDKINHKIPVIAGTGTNNTKTSIEMSKYAQDVGCDGVLVVTPYYNKCNQEGLYNHYKQISDAINIDIILYNVPTRTGVNIEIDTLKRLSMLKNITGIKEANNDISRIATIISDIPSLGVYSGNDDLTLPILALGGHGVISVAANIIPNEMHKICKSYFNEDINNATLLYYTYLDLMKKLFIDVNPICIKEAMNILNYNVGKTRLPLYEMDTTKYIILKDCLKKLNLI